MDLKRFDTEEGRMRILVFGSGVISSNLAAEAIHQER